MALDRDRFAAKFVRALRASGVKGDIQYHASDFKLSLAESHEFFLGNAYADYCKLPWWRRGRVLRQYASSQVDIDRGIPSSYEEARKNILPRVRDRNYYGLVELGFRKAGRFQGESPFVYQPLAEHLAVELVYDMPSSVASISPSTLAGWGQSFDEVMKAARFNLRMRSAGGFACPRPGLFVSPWRDNYDCGRLILTEVISRLEVKGDQVAMVPHRDALLVTGSDDAEGLSAMAALAEPLVSDHRRVSARLVRLAAGGWVPFALTPAHPAYPAVHRMQTICTAQDYEQQKEALEAIHAQSGEDVFVASCTVMQNQETGRLWSYSLWAEGLRALLPHTEVIAFVSERFGGASAVKHMIPWQHVADTVGNLLAPTGLHPERYRVEGFPTDAQLAEMAPHRFEP